MSKIIVKDFNLNHTLESGQLFRYSKEDTGWRVNHRDVSFRVEQKDNKLIFNGTSESEIKKFLGLTQNFGNEGRFPNPGRLNNLELLKKCKVGFRAKYLYKMNKTVDEKFLKSLYKLNYEDAKTKLVELPGVGEKIADCVLLFAYNKFEAFPVDTWMKKVMEELYLKKETPVNKISSFGRQKFGKYAGYAQQYLYHWRRNSE